MTLPVPWPGSISNPVDFLVYLNEVTGYALGYGTLFSLFVITFLAISQRFDVARSFAAASWLTALCSYPFAVFSLVGVEVSALLTILGFISIVFIKDSVEYI